jgi:hypothetical protein
MKVDEKKWSEMANVQTQCCSLPSESLDSMDISTKLPVFRNSQEQQVRRLHISCHEDGNACPLGSNHSDCCRRLAAA